VELDPGVKAKADLLPWLRMTVRLAVAGAFHTEYMQPAVAKLQEALSKTEIKTPRIPVISNVDAKPHSDPATIKAILAKQAGGVEEQMGLSKHRALTCLQLFSAFYCSNVIQSGGPTRNKPNPSASLHLHR